MGNLSVLSGTIVRDAEVKIGKNGGVFVAFSLLTDGPFFIDDSGKKKPSSVYHRVVVHGQQNWLERWLAPEALEGRYAVVRGQIRNSSFLGDDGNRVRLSEVVADKSGIEFPDYKARSEQVS